MASEGGGSPGGPSGGAEKGSFREKVSGGEMGCLQVTDCVIKIITKHIPNANITGKEDKQAGTQTGVSQTGEPSVRAHAVCEGREEGHSSVTA